MPRPEPRGLYETGRFDAPGGAVRLGGPELTARALDLGGWHAGERVLDLGCGGGASLAVLRARGIVAVGVDVSRAALAEARRGGAAVAAADGANLPFAAGGFAGVLAECSLGLMTDLPRTLDELRRVLAPGGRLVAGDPYRRAAEPPPDGAPARLRGLRTQAEWRDLLAAHGFAPGGWEDRSEALRAFVARVIFAGGSAGDVWCAPGAGAEAVKRMRPGYALFVARRADN
jgi:SAM-dependent methyltransferase